MKAKKVICLLIATLLIFSGCFAFAGATTIDKDRLMLKPGNTQSANPEYSKAWLDKLIVRDDATSIKAARMVPEAEYPYEKTYSQFVKDANDLAVLYALNEDTLTTAIESTVKQFYTVVTAMGMTDDTQAMYNYVSKKGVRAPGNLSSFDKMELAVVYAALKYKAVYVLYGKDVVIPEGITLDSATASVMAGVMGITITSDVRSIGGLAVYFAKLYVTEFDKTSNIPLSANPGTDEIFHWMRAIVASKDGYSIPLISFDEATQAQKDYVSYAYYSTILNTIYDTPAPIHINPFELVKADSEADTTAIPRVILKTMLATYGAKYDPADSTEALFDKCCGIGYFDLDEELYSDIYNYVLYVKKDAEKLWFTPFSLADQLDGGNVNYVSIKANNKFLKSAETSYIRLDPKKDTQTLKITVTYDDKVNPKDVATYTFKIIRTDEKVGNLVGASFADTIMNQITSMLPKDNQKVNAIAASASQIVSGAGKAEKQVRSKISGAKDKFDSFVDTTAQGEAPKKAQQTENDGDKAVETYQEEQKSFAYLNELISDTYTQVTYNQVTSQTQKSFTERAVEKIKESPEIVAAPTSVIALGAIGGYIFTKKKKQDQNLQDGENVTNGKTK